MERSRDEMAVTHHWRSERAMEALRATSRWICSICGDHLLPGEPVLLDSRQYDLRRGGSDWVWHHADCKAIRRA